MKKSNFKQAKEKKDIYQEVTDYVTAELEKGNVIWQQGWSSYGMPKNIITDTTYRGWNLFWLNFLTQRKKYNTPYFLTYKQAVDAGGHIKKGEKGMPIIYWALVENKRETIVITDTTTGEESESHPTYRVPKQHIVFNIDQTEGIDFTHATALNHLDESQRVSLCEQVVAEMPNRPAIYHRGGEAYYAPSKDEVVMPPFGRFFSEGEYYSTLFHELAHSTGHASRLNRAELVNGGGFGSDKYGKEELTAELTAAFLCATCGIEQTINNSVAYLQGWLKTIKGDKTLILRASTQAQAAADYILSSAAGSAIKEQSGLSSQTA